MTPEDGEPLGMSSANAEKAAELFDLHFNRVYDFSLRVLGLPDAAADVAEESLRNALAAPATGSFDVRLFSAALDALEPRLKLRHPSSIGSNPLFHQVDVARLADATRAPSAQETGGLIWETTSRLDPADYVLLDLRFRQNLSESDLAAILKTNERAVRARLSKLLKRTEPELSALIVGRRGSRNCEGMRRAMLGLPIAATRGQVRKAVEKHVRSCPVCTATSAGLASPLLVLAAFSLITPSAADSEAARGRLLACRGGNAAPHRRACRRRPTSSTSTHAYRCAERAGRRRRNGRWTAHARHWQRWSLATLLRRDPVLEWHGPTPRRGGRRARRGGSHRLRHRHVRRLQRDTEADPHADGHQDGSRHQHAQADEDANGRAIADGRAGHGNAGGGYVNAGALRLPNSLPPGPATHTPKPPTATPEPVTPTPEATEVPVPTHTPHP
jgi:DNA-directed RNA polymerase specialized sigma24 family protein